MAAGIRRCQCHAGRHHFALCSRFIGNVINSHFSKWAYTGEEGKWRPWRSRVISQMRNEGDNGVLARFGVLLQVAKSKSRNHREIVRRAP